MRPPRRALIVALTPLLLTGGPLVGPASSHHSTGTVKILAEGIWLYRQKTMVNVNGTLRETKVFVVEIDPSVPTRGSSGVDVATPFAQIPGKKLTSAMGTEHRAVASINGDFGYNRMLHAFAQDGTLWQSGLQRHANLAVTVDGSRAWVDRPKTRITALVEGTATTFEIHEWNSGKPEAGEIAGYSPPGGSVENPPANGSYCSVRLFPTNDPIRWAPSKRGVERTYKVKARKCYTDTTFDEMSSEGGVVLTTPDVAGQAKSDIRSLARGTRLRIRWFLGWPKVLDSIGGRPQLLDVVNGVVTNVAPLSCGICGRNPRTAVGVNMECIDGAAGCRVFLVVVDGRQWNWSVGMTLRDLASYMKDTLGIAAAVNLDGGGSSTVWIRKTPKFCQIHTAVGCIVNRPTKDGSTIVERTVETAVLAIPGPDTKPKAEPVPAKPL
jgi:hypothetical protein